MNTQPGLQLPISSRLAGRIRAMEITHKDGGTLGIGNIPGRKRKALYRMHGCSIDPIAYFASDEDAEWLERFLECLCVKAGAHFEEP